MKQNKKIIIDARNKNCPLPLIMLKKALKRHKNGFILLINNQIAKENIERFLSENQIGFEYLKDNGAYKFFVNTPQNADIKDTNIQTHPYLSDTETATGKHVICIKSDKMGHGSDELGKILLEAFINNLKEIAPLPAAVIFYNNGIMLTLKDSAVIDNLKKLESLGVKILVCGTCIDYYNVKKRIGVGIISNMYEITEQLTNTSHIIYP